MKTTVLSTKQCLHMVIFLNLSVMKGSLFIQTRMYQQKVIMSFCILSLCEFWIPFGDCPGKDYLLITSNLLFTQGLKVNGLGNLEIIVGQDRRKTTWSQFKWKNTTVQRKKLWSIITAIVGI